MSMDVRKFNSYEDALIAGFKIDLGNGEYGCERMEKKAVMPKCQKCDNQFEPEEINDSRIFGVVFQDKLCYHCFEESIEEYEEKKRKRIARDNEY